MTNRFFSNWIVRNLLGAAAFLLILALAVNVVLGIITHHGQIIAVPDMTSLSVTEAQQVAEANELRIEVTDSVFVRRMKRGAVFTQNPKPGSKVKKGRSVKLTINANISKKVSVPNLVGYSMRQAKAELLSRGLSLGRLVYVNDMATNNVLKQLLRNSEVKPYTEVEAGTSIDLVVGLSDEDNMTYVPDVVGLSYIRSVDAVQDNYLNVRQLVFDQSVKNYSDSLAAVVFRQSPGSSNSAPVKMGTEVALFLTVDPAKIPVTR